MVQIPNQQNMDRAMQKLDHRGSVAAKTFCKIAYLINTLAILDLSFIGKKSVCNSNKLIYKCFYVIVKVRSVLSINMLSNECMIHTV